MWSVRYALTIQLSSNCSLARPPPRSAAPCPPYCLCPPTRGLTLTFYSAPPWPSQLHRSSAGCSGRRSSSRAAACHINVALHLEPVNRLQYARSGRSFSRHRRVIKGAPSQAQMAGMQGRATHLCPSSLPALQSIASLESKGLDQAKVEIVAPQCTDAIRSCGRRLQNPLQWRRCCASTSR